MKLYDGPRHIREQTKAERAAGDQRPRAWCHMNKLRLKDCYGNCPRHFPESYGKYAAKHKDPDRRIEYQSLIIRIDR